MPNEETFDTTSDRRIANLSGLERAVSGALGAIFLRRALATGDWRGLPLGRLLLGAAGFELIRRGVSGHCIVTDMIRRPGRGTQEIRRFRHWRHEPEAPSDPIDRDAADSFPASDPPGWIPVSGLGSAASRP
jgi:hypothetical protein